MTPLNLFLSNGPVLHLITISIRSQCILTSPVKGSLLSPSDDVRVNHGAMKEPLRHTITCIHKVSVSRFFPVKLSHTHTHFSSLLFFFILFVIPVIKPSLDLVHAGKEFKNNACKVLTMFFRQQQHSQQ